ncbi:ABC transporter ATP-binding protein [Actinotalea sp. K2]|uniref:ABC transporter ATP-binding protein n=1 Tax=Actinotalea sp. K2 TaxID=2939438 RepID=UPI00201770CC|nr:ABC transporter ATP-binding protein [Actinotalea sp. K2]MCL3861706.1 ABC transporter ATP-binding protein/permease [Actinotalea sp. K2]
MNQLDLLRPVRGLLILAAAFQAVAAALTLVPLLALIAFTGAWLEGDPAPGPGVVLAAVGGALGSLGAAALATVLTHRADADLTWQLRTRLARTIRHLPVPVVTGHGAGRIKKVLHDDTGALHYLVAHTLLDLTALVVTPLAGLVALALIDWRLALLALLPLVVGTGCFVRAMRGSAANFVQYATQQQRISTAIVDFVRGLPVAKVYGGPGSAQARFRSAVTDFHDFFRAWSRGTAPATTASWLVVTPAVAVALLTLAGAVGLRFGWVTPTALVAGVLLGPAVCAPVAVVGPRIQAIRTGLSAVGSINAFLAQPRLVWGDGGTPGGTGVLRLDHVSYAYGDEQAALVDVTLELPATGLVAVVGESGSGKSTLAGLLARFIDPTQGSVRLGGVDLRELSEETLYQQVGFVFQDTGLRQASIRDVLTGGRPTPERDVVWAAVAAAIHDDVLALSRGYDTVLGQDTDLSGGQRQRLCLARALLRRPTVLVLDEATSALDPTTRAVVMETLTREATERTVLLLTHQLATVTRADQVVVLESGRLAGVGTHHELLEGCAAYRTLWETEPPPPPERYRTPVAATPKDV